MKKRKENGFVLMIILVLLILITAELVVLTGGSKIILFQTSDFYLRAVEQNMISSGLAWAKNSVSNQSIENFNKTIELDLTDIKISEATLSVNLVQDGNEQAKIQLNTFCKSGRNILKHNGKYRK